MSTTPEAQREQFEAWLLNDLELPATWNGERNCFDEFTAHIAFKAWQAARTRSVPEVPAAPTAWLAANDSFGEQGEQKYLVIADDAHPAIRELVGAFPVYAHQAMPAAVEARTDALQHEAVPSAMDACDSAESGQDDALEPFSVPIESEAAALLRDLIGCGDDDASPITLCLCVSEDGPGLHVYLTEYPEEGVILLAGTPVAFQLGQQGRMQAAKTAGSDDKRAALTESILALGTVEQTAPVIGLLVAYIESLAVAEGSE